MSVCQLHRYNPKRQGKPVHYGDCGLCRTLYDRYLKRQRWKRSERVVARKAGARRNPGSGAATPSNRGDATREGVFRLFSLVENRQRQTWNIPGWVREMREKAPPTGPWLLVASRPGERRQVAILDYDDLLSMLRDYLDSLEVKA